jgi:hypothetical protein
MSFSFNLTNFFTTTEADVVALIAKVAAGVQLAEADIDRGLKWIAGEVPSIVSALQTAVGLAQTVSLVDPAELVAANAAVQALNAFAAAENSGKSDATSVVNGYVAYKSAMSAVATASASAAKAALPAAGSTAAVTAANPSA